MKKIKLSISKRISDHLIQAVLIFASVFLAFWLSDYRQNQSEKQQVKNAIDAVVNEVSLNKGVLERLMPVLQSTVSRTEHFLENSLDTVTVFNDYYLTANELRFNELITDDSYQYLNQNNIYIAIDKRLLINRIYKQQEFVISSINELVQFYKQRELFDSDKTTENYIIFYRNIREIEGQLIAMLTEYENALKKLSSGND
jgi:hypothetical protein